jgi:hypothetical protein
MQTATALTLVSQSLVAANTALASMLQAQGYAALIGPFSEGVATAATYVVGAELSIGISRVDPLSTLIQLPGVATRKLRPVSVFDWSELDGEHQIIIAAATGELILPSATQFTMVSTPTALAGITLRPSVDLGGWLVS